jgi:hypothetical protein
MAKYTDVWKMSSLWLVMEFKRLVELEATGEKDKDVSYDASDLEEQIMHRLNEYDVDR